MKFVAIVIGLIGFALNSVFAQELIVLDESKVINHQISYRAQNSLSSFPNYILNEIAITNQITVNQIVVNANCYFTIRVIKLSSTSYRLNVKSDSIIYLSNNNYHGFSVQSILLPDSIMLQIRLIDRNSNRRFDISAPLVYNVLVPEYSWMLEDSTKQASFGLAHVEMEFFFDENRKFLFDDFKKQVKNYPVCANNLADIEKELAAVDLKNMAMVPLYFIDVKDAKKKLLGLKPEEKFNLLCLNVKDSLSYINRYNSALLKTDQLYKDLNQLNKALDYEYYNQAYVYEKQGNITNALKFYNKSIALNPAYTPAIYRIAFIQYSFDSLAASAENLHKILAHNSADFTTKQSALSLSELVMNAMIEKALNYNQNQLFNESIEILSKTLEFCSKTPEISCSPRFYQAFSVAKYGLFDSYLTITRKAIQKQKLDLAFDYLKIAETYQQENRNEIVSSFEIDKIKGELALISIQKAEQKLSKFRCLQCIDDIERARVILNSQSKIDTSLLVRIQVDNQKAVQCIYGTLLQKASKKIHQKLLDEAYKNIEEAINYQINNPQFIPNSEGTDTLIKAVKNIEYQEYINIGSVHLGKQKITLAYTSFLQAKYCEEDSVVVKSDSLTGLIKACLKEVLFEKIKDAQLKAWGSKFTEADSILRSVDAEIKEYSFVPDSALSSELALLKSTIENNFSSKIQNEFRKNIQLGIANAELKDYLEAEKAWNNANEISRGAKLKTLDTSQVYLLLNNHKAEIAFAHQISDFQRFIEQRDWDNAIHLYQNLQSEYSQNTKLIGKFRIPQLLQVCNENSDQMELLIKSITYYDSLQLYDNAFAVIELLPKEMAPTVNDKQKLKSVAQNAAKNDCFKNPKTTKKNLFLLRFKNKNTASYIKMAYLLALLKA